MRVLLSLIGVFFTVATLGLFCAALSLGAVFWIYGRDLPSYQRLALYTPPTISRVFDGDGQILDEFAKERRLYTLIEDIPDLVRNAFVAAEDQNFYQHQGYDARGMVSALKDAIVSRGRNVRGASTITQQVMKNFLLSGDRTGERKIKEIILATRLEKTLSKDKILELYLNEIFLGQNSYGVTAAAQTYFNKTLDALNVEEAAVLASLPTQPSNFHPVRGRKLLLDRRNYVIRRMGEDGYITQTMRDLALEAPLLSVQAGDYTSFRDAIPPRSYFTDEIRRQLSGSFGEDEFFSGGLTIRATVDPALQETAAIALQAGLEAYDRNRGRWRGTGLFVSSDKLAQDWRAALTDISVPRDIKDWHVAVVLSLTKSEAVIGIDGVKSKNAETIPLSELQWARKLLPENKLGPKVTRPSDLLTVGEVIFVRRVTYKGGEFNHWSLHQLPELEGAFMAMDVNTGRVLAMQGGFSYQTTVFNRATQALRQPGSAFKPFVYAAALDSGFTPSTVVVDAPIEINTPEGLWSPKNSSDKYFGPTPLRTGIEQSRNLMTVRVAQEIGMDRVATYAEKFGVYSPMQPYLANSLGAQETTLFKVVAAYAMFANGGERVEPTLVDRVQDRFGTTVYRHDQRRCLSCGDAQLPVGEAPLIFSDRERVMDAITAYQLTSMLQGVLTRGTARSIVLPVPIAGKTGTTNDSKDGWFVGFSSNIVAGCYMGFDQPRSMGRGVYGGALCGPAFQSFMERAIAKFGGSNFRVPPNGYFLNIDRFSGARLPDDAVGDNVIAEYFRNDIAPVFGQNALVDGGFTMGSNLPLFVLGESDDALEQNYTPEVPTEQGGVAQPKTADFGTLSSGGLY